MKNQELATTIYSLESNLAHAIDTENQELYSGTQTALEELTNDVDVINQLEQRLAQRAEVIKYTQWFRTLSPLEQAAELAKYDIEQ